MLGCNQLHYPLINEIVGILGPLRAVFETGGEKKVYLLLMIEARIGGPAALEAAVEIFYEKIVADPNLAKFFDGVDMDKLMRAFSSFFYTRLDSSWRSGRAQDDGFQTLSLL